MTLGVVLNPVAPRVSTYLVEVARGRGIDVRVIDLPTLVVDIDQQGSIRVVDRAGVVEVDAIAPYLLFGFPAAVHALRTLAQTAYGQNPVDAALVADDKAATALRLAQVGVPQVSTVICADLRDQVLAVASAIGYPIVLKRTHGAQGRWVRRADDREALSTAYDELMAEGPGALLLQPFVAECAGTSVRAIVTGRWIVAATQRTAADGEWRSNVTGGASQVAVDLSAPEMDMITSAVTAIGLGHAGVDLLRTASGSVILEVNSCPDFTSMLPHCSVDIGGAVVEASLAAG